MKKLLNIFVITAFVFSSLIITSCEDPIPYDYIPNIFVEAYLVVDEPIENIIIMRSQPFNEKFKFEEALIKDATVKIIGDGKVFDLSFRNSEEGEPGYCYHDYNYSVKSEMLYELHIELSDGTILTGTTFTPKRTQWVKPPHKEFYFPQDTNKLPLVDSLRISWEKVEGVDFFTLMLKPLDTLEYGQYLDPPTEEKNRRILKPWSEDEHFYEQSSWALIPATESPVVWGVFKWYGYHEIAVCVPDDNFLRWLVQSFTRNNIDPLLSSIEGGYGVFGSVSMAKDTFFLKMNIPK